MENLLTHREGLSLSLPRGVHSTLSEWKIVFILICAAADDKESETDNGTKETKDSPAQWGGQTESAPINFTFLIL